MTPNDDKTLFRHLEASRVFALAERIRMVTLRALHESRTTATLRRLAEKWPAGSARLFDGGVLLLVAAAVHLVIADHGLGWLTFILPGIAATIGAAAVVMSSHSPGPTR